MAKKKSTKRKTIRKTKINGILRNGLNGKKKSRTQEIKSKARRNLNRKVDGKRKNYVIDTSAVINKFLPRLFEKGLKGKLIIPNSVMAELENLANKGNEAGFIGLDQVANLHNLKKRYKFTLEFRGPRPEMKHIRFAKSGEIDALIRDMAFKDNATLVTADLVQAKSAQAYGLKVIFIKPRAVPEKKKSWLSFLRKKSRK
jgi:predicted PilT family ATPase